MTRTIFACFAFALAFAAHADVTLKSTATGKGFGISGSTTSTTYIKGLKMRTDTTAGKKQLSTIFDVDAQKMYVLDVEDKKAKVWDMAAFATELSSHVAPEGMQASLKANGQTKTVSGQNTEGYDIAIVVPTTVGGMEMTMHLTGTTWIAKGVPGSADYAAVHGLPAQRFVNVLCIAYGAEPRLFQDFVKQGFLPAHRIGFCRWEYQQIRYAFHTLISPHIDPVLQEKVRGREWLRPDDGSEQ